MHISVDNKDETFLASVRGTFDGSPLFIIRSADKIFCDAASLVTHIDATIVLGGRQVHFIGAMHFTSDDTSPAFIVEHQKVIDTLSSLESVKMLLESVKRSAARRALGFRPEKRGRLYFALAVQAVHHNSFRSVIKFGFNKVPHVDKSLEANRFIVDHKSENPTDVACGKLVGIIDASTTLVPAHLPVAVPAE